MAMFVSLASPEEQLGEVVVSIAKLRNDPEPPTATLALVKEGKHLEVMRQAVDDASVAFRSGTNEVLLYSAIVALARATLPDHADELSQKVIKSVAAVKDEHVEARLQVLVAVHNLVVGSAVREEALLAAVDYITESKQEAKVGAKLRPAAVIALLKDVDAPLQRKLYQKLLGLMTAAGQSDEARYEVLRSYLASYESADDKDVAEAKDAARDVAKLAVAIPSVHQCVDVLQLRALQSIKDDAHFELLSLFATERLPALEAFESKNGSFFKDAGIDREAAFKKMRLLSLASLAADSATVPYDEVVSTLKIGEEDVEEWVIEAINAGLIQAKMNQLERVIKIQGCIRRSFERAHWEQIQTCVSQWRSNVGALLTTLKESSNAAAR